jgi:hypothetical protein
MRAMRLPFAASRHGRAAFRADLGVFSVHARRDFCFVRDEFGAQPHRVRRTGLAHVNGLGGSTLQAADQKRANRQRQATDKSKRSHGVPRLLKALSRGETSGRAFRRRWLSQQLLIDNRSTHDQLSLRQANAFGRARARAIVTSVAHRSSGPSVTCAVTLSNDTWRQKIPSGIV